MYQPHGDLDILTAFEVPLSKEMVRDWFKGIWRQMVDQAADEARSADPEMVAGYFVYRLQELWVHTRDDRTFGDLARTVRTWAVRSHHMLRGEP